MQRTEEEQRIVHDIMNSLWRFNKKCLELDLEEDATWEELYNQVIAETKDVDSSFKDFAIELFNSSLKQLDRLRKERK